MKKRNRIIGIVLSLMLVLGLMPTIASAAESDTQIPFSFEIDKNVKQGGEAAPGEETFTFELVYGTVDLNDQYSFVFTPDSSVSLADCGIAFTSNTITTNGVGEQTFTLGGTVDLEKANAQNHWQVIEGTENTSAKSIITLRLTEKNDGKTGWTYSDAERYLTITVQGGIVTSEVHLLGHDAVDNNFENIYTAAAPAAPAEQSKPIDSPPTGDSTDMGLWFALMLAAVCTGGTVLYSRRCRSER